MELLILFLIGFILGIKHAFDADHIVAVNTLLSKSKNIKNSLKLGAFWGIGHTLTLFLIGSIILFLGFSISNKLGLFFELFVGIMLIFLGISTIHKKLEAKLRKYDGTKKSLGIGIIHGIAGSAALMLLIVSKITNIYLGLIYILVFGVGTIFGMMFVSLILFKFFHLIFSGKKLSNMAGIISIILGIIIIYDIGFIQGLFLI